MKSLGPSNDAIPSDEMLLAMALQSAQARGWKACMGQYYREADGTPANVVGAESCCAVGALLVDGDTKDIPPGVVSGNDGLYQYDYESGWTLGAAFQEAMREG